MGRRGRSGNGDKNRGGKSGKSSKSGDSSFKRGDKRKPYQKDGRGRDSWDGHSSKGGGPGKRKGPSISSDDVLEALERAGEAMSASRLTEAMGMEGPITKDVSRYLRELAEADLAIEIRPGRFAIAGHDGEFPVEIVALEDDGIGAKFQDDSIARIPPLHRMGAKVGDSALAIKSADGGAMLTRLIERAGRRIPGTLDFRYGRVSLVPDRRREGAMPVLSDPNGVIDRYRAGDRVVGIMEEAEWGGGSGVTLERILAEDSPEVADFELVRLMHDLPEEFPPELLAAAEGISTDFELGSRKDCRDDLVFTIDPATAKDFDDAICVTQHDHGWRLAVHIADVSHFVQTGSMIDMEARNRGTSCYLVNRVIPMLPEHLSNGLCSLVPNEPRYVLSIFISLDKRCTVTGVELAESLIQSRHRLTYEQALEVIEERNQPDEWPDDLLHSLRGANQLAQQLRRRRVEEGALNLYGVEQKFALDVEGNPIEVQSETSDVAHQLIEEFMLLANREVAHWLESRVPAVVYRVHGEPDEQKLEFFQQILETYGIRQLPVHERGALQQVLRRLEQEPEASRLVLNFCLLRCFQKAVYDVENIGHYALAFKHYAHFTSPIRRYPDLIIHRLVKHALELPNYFEQVETEVDVLDVLAKRCSFLERRAEDGERALLAIKAARYLDNRVGDHFAGVVLGASPAGLYIHLLEVGLEGLLPLRELKDDFYNLDRERQCLVGIKTGRVLGVGQEIEVQVVSVDIMKSDVILGPLDAIKPLKKH